jgi:hypothetical protein
MFERPSAHWESLNAVLGLGHVDEMLALLARERIDADKAARDVSAKLVCAFCAHARLNWLMRLLPIRRKPPR